ncbi:hypothetical protein J132_01126, partial [Termitomyces sp. J132]
FTDGSCTKNGSVKAVAGTEVWFGHEDKFGPETPWKRETLEHILTECEVSGQQVVWALTEKTHKMRGVPFTKPTLGEQLGCAIISRNDTEGKRSKNMQHFSTIMVCEATHLIWKMRCNWQITKGRPRGTPQQERNYKEVQGHHLKKTIIKLPDNRCKTSGWEGNE